jgi:hypothetical protein
VQGYDFYTIRMLADDRYSRRVDEASAERQAQELRGTARQRTARLLRAAWSGLPGRLRSEQLPEQARSQW